MRAGQRRRDRDVDLRYEDGLFAKQLLGHRRDLGTFARRLTRSPSDADDLLQDTLLKCWAARSSFQQGSNFVGWTRAVMRNTFLSARRRDWPFVEVPDIVLENARGVEPSQEWAVHLGDAAAAFSRLPAPQSAALSLVGMGASIEEAAEELGIPQGTLRSRVFRARSRMREMTAGTRSPAALADVARIEAPEPRRRRRRLPKGTLIG